jgi:hypothetical protein
MKISAKTAEKIAEDGVNMSKGKLITLLIGEKIATLGTIITTKA